MEKFFTTKEVAEMLKAHKQSIINSRSKGNGMPYVKLGRKVLYRERDIQAYLEENTIRPKNNAK